MHRNFVSRLVISTTVSLSLVSIAHGGNCEAPLAVAEGARAILVSPQPIDGVNPMALHVTSPDFAGLNMYVQADGGLGCEPVFQTPIQWGSIAISNRYVVPDSDYSIQADCGGGVVSADATVTTWRWGDVNHSDAVDLDDILCELAGFSGNYTNCAFRALNLMGHDPDATINLDDLLATIGAFGGAAYAGPLPPAQALSHGLLLPSANDVSDFTIGDINGDGLLDLAATHFQEDSLSFWINNCGNGFDSPVTFLFDVDDAPERVVIADVDNDLDGDLVVTMGEGSVEVWFNNGQQAFSRHDRYETPQPAYGLAVADIDNDFDLDILPGVGGVIRTLLNNSAGVFTTGPVLGSNGIPIFDVRVGDDGGDGDLDIAAFNTLTHNVGVIRNNGAGSFQTTSSLPNDFRYVYNGVFVDLDGQHGLDLAAPVENHFAVSLCNSNGTFASAVSYPLVGDDVASGDIDGDLDNDLFITSSPSPGTVVALLLNNGDGSFALSGSIPAFSERGPNNFSIVELVDIDQDDDLDILSSSTQSGIKIFLNDGTGDFGQE